MLAFLLTGNVHKSIWTDMDTITNMGSYFEWLQTNIFSITQKYFVLLIIAIITFCEYGLCLASFEWKICGKHSNVLRRPVFCRITSKRMFWHHIHTENKKNCQCRDETLNYCNKTFVNIVRSLPSKAVFWHLKKYWHLCSLPQFLVTFIFLRFKPICAILGYKIECLSHISRFNHIKILCDKRQGVLQKFCHNSFSALHRSFVYSYLNDFQRQLNVLLHKKFSLPHHRSMKLQYNMLKRKCQLYPLCLT